MLKLSEKNWKEFSLGDERYFSINSGVRLTKKNMLPGNTPFIGATDSNNGITSWVSNTNRSLDSNVLGVNYNGSVVENFYHPYSAIFSDDVKRVKINIENPNMTHYLFLKTMILKQKEKYAYGYKFNGERMSNQKILLPINDDENPDWIYMDSYISKKIKNMRSYFVMPEINTITDFRTLNDVTWGAIEISRLFEIDKSFTEVQGIKSLPYISAKKMRNGLKAFSTDFKHAKLGNTITWNKIGDGGAGLAYYQEKPYVVDNINVMVLKPLFDMNKYSGLFIASVLSMYHSIFGHGYTLTDKRFSVLKVKLPMIDDKSDTVDFNFMEQYMMRNENKVLEQIEIKEADN